MGGISINYRLTLPDSLRLQQPVSAAAAPPSTSSSLSSTLTSAASSVPVKPSAYREKKWACFESAKFYFSRLIGKVEFFFRSFFYPTINPKASIPALEKTWFGLGTEKWKECIDAKYHHLGRDVFKLGTHGGCKEPGYVPSMEEAYKFCAKYLNKKVDSNWYLQLHQITCGHFDGDPDVYLMAQDKVGVFRGPDDNVHWWPSGNYEVTPEATAELIALDARITREFGPGYGMGAFAVDPATRCMKHSYTTMPRAHIQRIFDRFMTDFYTEVEQATTPGAKLTAIARLNKHLELLHPPKDGSGRTNTVLINKILTEYGFTPALLDNPYVSTTYGLTRWTQYLTAGVAKWGAERSRLLGQVG